MKVVIAIDSLKGSLTSLEAGDAIGRGALKAVPNAEVVVRPLADGGEGTVEALTIGLGGKLIETQVTGPLGKKVSCLYGILEEKQTAIIEMAGAAGITLVPDEKRNPMETTTYGVGETILDAIKRGCRKFVIGIGGSATNDGGIGMLQALGYGMLDKNGKQVSLGGKGLRDLAKITDEGVVSELAECTFKIACDVKNPLCGERGCSNVFGPQKGADAEMIEKMDKWLEHYARMTQKWKNKRDDNSQELEKIAGAGAAGGLGFAFLAYLIATLEPGIKIVLEETGLEGYVKDADIVVTGEGRLDEQTVMGKAPVGVARIAKKYDKPVIAFAGCVTTNAGRCNEAGIDAFFPILRTVVTLDQAMKKENAQANLENTSEQVFRLIRCMKTAR